MDLSIKQFLFNNGSMSLFFLFLLLIRKIVGDRLNPRLRGNFWYLPFLSIFFLILHQPLANLKMYLHYNLGTVPLFQNDWVGVIRPELINIIDSSDVHWLNDYSVSAGASLDNYTQVILIIWIPGASIMELTLLVSFYKLHVWVKEGELLESLKIRRCLTEAQAALNTQTKVKIISSKKVQAPATSGIFRPIILLPRQYCEKISEEHLTLILMHELGHHKNKDFYQQSLFLLFTLLFFGITRVSIGWLEKLRRIVRLPVIPLCCLV